MVMVVDGCVCVLAWLTSMRFFVDPGFRGEAGKSTQWPSGMTVGASWDPAVMEAWGKGMGEEFIGKGANVQLGPGVCLSRVPRNGVRYHACLSLLLL